jgi:hypothetical protein
MGTTNRPVEGYMPSTCFANSTMSAVFEYYVPNAIQAHRADGYRSPVR